MATDYLCDLMITTGRIQDLLVLRHTPEGLILGDEDDQEVLLPKTEAVKNDTIESYVRVFVHHDQHGRRIATTTPPQAQVGEFGYWKVGFIDHRGAHMEWGLEPELLVPHDEQKKPLDEELWYVVRVALNEANERIYGSTRIETFLDNTSLTVEQGDQVDLIVFSRSPLGLSVIVNNIHQGLIHSNEVFKDVQIGDRITGYVKQIREDNKLDITLQPIGYRQFNDVNATLLAKRLQASKGSLPFSDKSTAEEIHAEFGISKKAFKKALGALYKQRKVRIEDDRIVWIGR